jgi:HEAT repeat protein
LNAPDHGDYVQERKAELLDLTTSSDPSALPAILSALNNQDPEIRQTALSAVMQVGNKDALPALKNQLAWAEDPREKVAIQDAIDFLQLPPADQIKSEALAAQTAAQTQSSARH